MSFPRYPKYKPSGVEWLGDVPEHWEVRRLKHMCHVFPSNVDKKSYEGETPVFLCNYTDVYHNGKIQTGMAFMSATATPEQIIKYTLRAGDTIITKDSETADDIAISSYVPFDLPGVICGYHLSMIRPIGGVNGLFIKLLFDSVYTKSCFAVRANGLTRVGLGQYEIDNVELPFPSIGEQALIANFLDRETAKIDALVAEQQRLIELLKEKRQAVISHAVTKGLDPTVPMKPSGIEWLGDIPAHWLVTRLGYYARVENGTTPSRDNEAYWLDGNIPWLSSGEVNQYRVVEANEFITEKALCECSLRLLPKGTIIVGMIGQGKTRGTSALLEIEACINQNLAAIVPSNFLRSDYLLYIFHSMYDYLREFGRGGNQAALNCEILSALRVVIPPENEQDQISRYLGRQLLAFDNLTAEAERAIELLQERRTALISAAVTGQIDVRQLAQGVAG